MGDDTAWIAKAREGEMMGEEERKKGGAARRKMEGEEGEKMEEGMRKEKEWKKA